MLADALAFVEQKPLEAIFILTLLTTLILFKLNKARLRANKRA